MAASLKDNENALLKIVNALSYILFLGANAYALLGGHYGRTHTRDTFFTPKYFVFGLYLIIHYLLIGYLMYQHFPSSKPLIIDTIGWRFPILAVISSIYVGIHNFSYPGSLFFSIPTLILAILTCAALTRILIAINLYENTPKDFNDILWVYLPLALYHGFSVALVIVNIFDIAFERSTDPKVYYVILFVLGQCGLLAMCILYTAYFRNLMIEIPGACAIAWVILCIFIRRAFNFIDYITMGFFILMCIWIAGRLFAWYRSRNDQVPDAIDEQSPLLGEE